MQRSFFYILLLPLLFILFIYDAPKKEFVKSKPHKSELIPIKEKTYVPSPLADNTFQLLAYDNQKNTFAEKGEVFDGQYVGHVTKGETLYLINYNVISVCKINEKSEIEQPSKFLPTPRCESIIACYLENNQLNLITYSEDQLDIVSWVNDSWVYDKTISITKDQKPLGTLFLLEEEGKKVGLWESEKSTFIVNLSEDKIVVRKLPDTDLINIYFWKDHEGAHLTGFDKENIRLTSYQLKGLLKPHQIILKENLAKFPDFKYPTRLISLAPIIKDHQLKGYFYGTVFDEPVYVQLKSIPSQKEMDLFAYKKVDDMSVVFLISTIGLLIFIIFVTYKVSNLWENKLETLNIPNKAIFFGPTIHRGLAYLIDSLLVNSIILIITFVAPQFIDLNLLITVLSESQSVESIKEHIPSILKILLVMFLYSTFFDYFKGGTVGKMCTGLKVLSNKDLKKITLLQAILRNILPKVFDLTLVLASNILITITKKKRSLHDYIGNTVVVYARLHEKLKLKIEFEPDDPKESNQL